MTKLLREPLGVSGNSLQIYFARSASAVSASLEHEYLVMMPPGIRASILRYKRWQDRQATLFGKLLLLRALQIKFPDTGMEKFRSLEVTQEGKPLIRGWREFNISHSEDIVVLALTQSGAVGIDIEKIRTVNVEDFSQYVPEVANLQENQDVDRINNIFFDCWTQKEAVLKGSGRGLLVPLEHVLLKENMALLYETKWHTRKLPIDEDYCCHVATNQTPEDITIERVNLINGVL
jgi:4'-phosphopantetheinyl transferase